MTIPKTKPTSPDVRKKLDEHRQLLNTVLAAKFKTATYDAARQRLVSGCGLYSLQWDANDATVSVNCIARQDGLLTLETHHLLSRKFSPDMRGGYFKQLAPPGEYGPCLCVTTDGEAKLTHYEGGKNNIVPLPCRLFSEADLHRLLVGLQVELGGTVFEPSEGKPPRTLAEAEKEHIAEALQSGGSQGAVAKRLGISRYTLRRKKALYGLS